MGGGARPSHSMITANPPIFTHDRYVPRSAFLDSSTSPTCVPSATPASKVSAATGSSPHTANAGRSRTKGAKHSTRPINLLDFRKQFPPFSKAWQACVAANSHEGQILSFPMKAFPNRCRKNASLRKIIRLVSQFATFANTWAPPVAIFGPVALLSVEEWLESLRARGSTVPHMGRYALTVVSEVLEFDWNLARPAVVAAARVARASQVKRPPCLSFDFLLLRWRVRLLLLRRTRTPFGCIARLSRS